jgi:hypothetical protein
MKFYISFGQVHTHSINGKTLDKDCLAEIEADSAYEAHDKAMKIFNGIFHNCYSADKLEEIISYFPRGVIKI